MSCSNFRKLVEIPRDIIDDKKQVVVFDHQTCSFMVFSNVEDLETFCWSNYNTQAPSYYSERIRSELMRFRLWLDLDYKLTVPVNSREQHLIPFKEFIETNVLPYFIVHLKLYQIEVFLEDFLLFDMCDDLQDFSGLKAKLSMHCILSSKYYFKSISDIQEIVGSFVKNHEEFKDFFDMGVYNVRGTNMRLPLCKKPLESESRRKKLPLTYDGNMAPYYDCLIGIYGENEPLGRLVVLNQDLTKDMKLNNYEEEITENGRNFLYKSLHSKSLTDSLLPKTSPHFRERTNYNAAYNTVLFNKIKKEPVWCEICQKTHDESENFLFVKYTADGLLVSCFRARELARKSSNSLKTHLFFPYIMTFDEGNKELTGFTVAVRKNFIVIQLCQYNDNSNSVIKHARNKEFAYLHGIKTNELTSPFFIWKLKVKFLYTSSSGSFNHYSVVHLIRVWPNFQNNCWEEIRLAHFGAIPPMLNSTQYSPKNPEAFNHLPEKWAEQWSAHSSIIVSKSIAFGDRQTYTILENNTVDKNIQFLMRNVWLKSESEFLRLVNEIPFQYWVPNAFWSHIYGPVSMPPKLLYEILILNNLNEIHLQKIVSSVSVDEDLKQYLQKFCQVSNQQNFINQAKTFQQIDQNLTNNRIWIQPLHLHSNFQQTEYIKTKVLNEKDQNLFSYPIIIFYNELDRLHAQRFYENHMASMNLPRNIVFDPTFNGTSRHVDYGSWVIDRNEAKVYIVKELAVGQLGVLFAECREAFGSSRHYVMNPYQGGEHLKIVCRKLKYICSSNETKDKYDQTYDDNMLFNEPYKSSTLTHKDYYRYAKMVRNSTDHSLWGNSIFYLVV